ncbi:hypothetical protein Clacol_002425 [Clathrus columnatus]|uniref:Uncharacterized protein n=1 Tax=Clathrus columnatus TaxID=1419009 RepID=A0AAV5A5D4_9AGAM|nr:hypothetical protein Clacol_002425 [Clathrus columnatus]
MLGHLSSLGKKQEGEVFRIAENTEGKADETDESEGDDGDEHENERYQEFGIPIVLGSFPVTNSKDEVSDTASTFQYEGELLPVMWDDGEPKQRVIHKWSDWMSLSDVFIFEDILTQDILEKYFKKCTGFISDGDLAINWDGIDRRDRAKQCSGTSIHVLWIVGPSDLSFCHCIRMGTVLGHIIRHETSQRTVQ